MNLKSVVDQKGTRYELLECIGRGGQGEVYAVKGGRLVAKILLKRGPSHVERLKNQLAHVRRLPLNDLCIAKPLDMLRPPHAGYVMEMMTGMQPIKHLLKPAEKKAPTPEWYQKDGGLRRRLLLLGHTARVLAKLHARGLAYADPSPENIFVSSNPGFHEVWFIDSDNLCYEADTDARKAIYTPLYGAPELVRGKAGISTLTDVHAFAVIAYQLLVLNHPLIGDFVNDGEPELEEQALEGRIPWIDDEDDDLNRASSGIPRDFVLSRRLKELFQRTFGKGRSNPLERPKAAEWSSRLYDAADATLVCPTCKGTYYMNTPACPWCDTVRPSFVLVYVHVFDPGYDENGGFLEKPNKNGKKQKIVVNHMAVSQNIPCFISRRMAFGDESGNQNEPILEICFKDDQLTLKIVNGEIYRLVSPSGSHEKEIGEVEEKISLIMGKASWQVHFGASDKLHRAVRFELRQGGNL